MDGIVEVASFIPGVSIIASFAVLLSKLFGCDGIIAVANLTYPQDTLNKLEQYQKTCETTNHSYPSPNILSCGLSNSTYTITHCLERLDAKPADTSAAANLLPTLFLPVAIALLLAGFELSL